MSEKTVVIQKPVFVHNKSTNQMQKNGSMELHFETMTGDEFDDRFPINYRYLKWHGAICGENSAGEIGFWRTE